MRVQLGEEYGKDNVSLLEKIQQLWAKMTKLIFDNERGARTRKNIENIFR